MRWHASSTPDEGLVGRHRQVHRVAVEHLGRLVERVPDGGGCARWWRRGARGGGRVVEPTLAVGALEGGVGLGDERGAVGVTARAIGVGGGDLGPVGHADLGPGRCGAQAERAIARAGDLHRSGRGREERGHRRGVVARVVRAAELAGRVHGELRCADVDGGHAHRGGGDGADRGAAGEVAAVGVALERHAGLLAGQHEARPSWTASLA